ncbi:MAG TPA: alpha/beta hydrolase [Hyphomonas sp.]|nr:alpha/beta hydrolase [Hyphomonas sp.]MCB9963125.1 alpha/beta hydrolase [Hyphomonas sp.]MCB9970125.1 alpha/beta hydrolase [Hyphomonas sp.]HPE48479.1 alpha/beta hydrolase [Hyphomonas sp.]
MRIVGIVLALVMSWFALPGEASAKVWRDVIYDHMPGVGEGNFTMDIYAPDNAKKAPVVIMVHGGAWVTGNKQFSIGPDQAHFFNEQGFIYIAINYRLAPDHAFPAPVQDTASAISFVHKEIRKYGGDPNAIFLLGHSSGAHTVALVSIDPKYLAAYGLGVDVIKGTVPLDGAAYNLVRTAGKKDKLPRFYYPEFGKDPKVWKRASPTLRVRDDVPVPPMLLLYVDRPVSPRRAKELADTLVAHGHFAQAVEAKPRSHKSLNRRLGSKGDKYGPMIVEFYRGQLH